MTAVVYPTTGFDPDFSVSSLVINGYQATSDVTAAISEAQLERTIVGASTLTLTLEDPFRTITNSNLAQIQAPAAPAGAAPAAPGSGAASSEPYNPTTCAIEDAQGNVAAFALAEISKDQDELTLTFEDLYINQLRYQYAQGEGYLTASGTMTRADLMVQIIKKTGLNIPTVAVPDTFAGIQQVKDDTGDSMWGTTDEPNEDAWTCLTRLANDVEWRCFSNGQAIVIGPDPWLLTLPMGATFQEHVGGCDDIDFDWDINQAQATATVYCNTALLTFPPGVPATLKNMGVANGIWLTSDISRSLFQPDAQVGVVQPQPFLTEEQYAAAADGTSDTDVNPTPTASDTADVTGAAAVANSAVAYALKQVGKPYIWGGIGPGGYDCSGLTYAAYLSAGLPIPRTAAEQSNGLPHVSMSDLVAGDLIFYVGEGDGGTVANPGHVVMYIGGGNVVEAEMTGTNIQTGPIPPGALGAARPSLTQGTAA
jgi:cell wall-associated NlpC family hydrolase